jgi:hypothetical protein
MLGQKAGGRRIYVDIPVEVVHQLRISARINERNVVEEALSLLEEGLWPDRAPAAVAPAAAGQTYRGTIPYLELPPELIARLQPLADMDYRSVAGEAVVVLQGVLRRHRGEIEAAAAAQVAPERQRGRPPKGRKKTRSGE